LGKGKTPQNISAGPDNVFAGKLITFSDLNRTEVIEKNDIRSFSNVIFTGLGGGDTKNRLYESYYPFQQLLQSDTINTVSKSNNILVYSSVMEGKRRPEKFRQGLPYYYDQSYINY